MSFVFLPPSGVALDDRRLGGVARLCEPRGEAKVVDKANVASVVEVSESLLYAAVVCPPTRVCGLLGRSASPTASQSLGTSPRCCPSKATCNGGGDGSFRLE